MSEASILVFAFLVVLCLISVFNWQFAPRLSPGKKSNSREFASPRVSVLIPARNEAENLKLLLPGLRDDPTVLEVLVLDDQSQDNTQAVAQGFASQVLTGSPTPEGWLGKNWACWQLANKASGDLLLFVDADVRVKNGAITKTVELLEDHHAQAVTLFLKQVYSHWTQRAVIPFVVQLPLAGLLPLSFVHGMSDPRFLAANGQWFLVRKTAYFEVDGHRGIRGHVLDDMNLARALKKKFNRGVVSGLSGNWASVAMYKGAGDLKEGFEKNLYLLMGGGSGFFWIYYGAAALTLLAPLWVEPLWFFPCLFLTGLWRFFTARLFSENLLGLAWHPVGVVLYFLLALSSWRRFQSGVLSWKGRQIRADGSFKN